MTLKTHLTLGRVSNLPTVWTNVLAAALLVGAAPSAVPFSAVLLAMSLFYIAGMYLNDACDAEYDQQHQPYRPIPSGLITKERVESFALIYLSVACLLTYVARMSALQSQGSGSIGWLVSLFALITFIVAYNRHHKNNPYSPLLMAGCRASVLLCTAYVLTASLSPLLLAAIIACVAWIAGLTYYAKYQSGIPFALMAIPIIIGLAISVNTPASLLPVAALVFLLLRMRSNVGLLIAGVCLVDGIFIAAIWGLPGAVLSIVAFLLTQALQRYIAGT